MFVLLKEDVATSVEVHKSCFGALVSDIWSAIILMIQMDEKWHNRIVESIFKLGPCVM